MPLPIPSKHGESVSMDFITNLPNLDGYDAILTVVCLLTHMANFIPCNSTVNSRQFLELTVELQGMNFSIFLFIDFMVYLAS